MLLSLFCTDVKLLRRRARFLRSKNKMNMRVVVVALALGKKGHTLLPLPVCTYKHTYICVFGLVVRYVVVFVFSCVVLIFFTTVYCRRTSAAA